MGAKSPAGNGEIIGGPENVYKLRLNDFRGKEEDSTEEKTFKHVNALASGGYSVLPALMAGQ